MPDLPEIPTDAQVAEALRRLDGHATAVQLCRVLVASGHPVLQTQLAIQRAADRGLLQVNNDLSLSLVAEPIAA